MMQCNRGERDLQKIMAHDSAQFCTVFLHCILHSALCNALHDGIRVDPSIPSSAP